MQSLTPAYPYMVAPEIERRPTFMHDCPYRDGEGFIRYLRGNMRRKKDNMFLSEGPEGSGKSTTNENIVMRLNPRYDPVADSIFGINHLLDVLEEAREGQVHNIDEAINLFHNQDWASWESKAMSKLIRQMRIMRSTWALATPDFDGLHPYLRDYRIRQRFYHRPVFDEDGMGNGPPVPLWKSERFEYKENRVVTRWIDLDFDLAIENLDSDPRHAGYEQKKKDNFKHMVQAIRHRIGLEDEKEEKRKQKRAPKKRKTASPPTTT